MIRTIKQYTVKFFIFLTAFILSACISEDKPESINLALSGSVSLYNIFSDVKVVQLETTKESLLRAIGRVKYYNGSYYVMDRGSYIYCFDDRGKYQFKIASQGKGPGEYLLISAFTIDKFNSQIILVDVMTQRLLFFDMDGEFIDRKEVKMNNTMNYNRVFALNDSTILLNSFNHYQLVFYSLNEEKVIHKDFPIKGFEPWLYSYQLGNRTYALPNFRQDILDITEIKPVKHFTWCFGKNNNTERQIEKLISILENDHYNGCIHEAVGRDNLLNHYFIWIHETERFKIAVVEFENNFKHVVIDKKQNETFVFDYFKEGVSIALSSVYANKVITYEHRGQSVFKEMGRELPYFSIGYLSEEYQHIIDNHNSEIDNPFIVVYTFKE